MREDGAGQETGASNYCDFRFHRCFFFSTVDVEGKQTNRASGNWQLIRLYFIQRARSRAQAKPQNICLRALWQLSQAMKFFLP